MTLLAFEDLRGDIVGSSTNGSLTLSIELKFGGQTEITYFDLHLVVEEEISEFEISVDDSVTVQVFHSGADLVYVALDFELVKALTATQQFVEGLVLAQLEQDVHILSVLEEVLEADDVVLVKGAMDLDLGHQLLLGSSLGEGGLGNYLGSGDSLVFEVGEFEAASETSLSEELALEVLLDADFAVVLDDFLFDDGLGAVDTFLGMALLHFCLFVVTDVIQAIIKLLFKGHSLIIYFLN